jgi:hypothetical protein
MVVNEDLPHLFRSAELSSRHHVRLKIGMSLQTSNIFHSRQRLVVLQDYRRVSVTPHSPQSRGNHPVAIIICLSTHAEDLE